MINKMLEKQERRNKCKRCGALMVNMGHETTRTVRMYSYRKVRKWMCPSCGFEMDEVVW